MELPARLNKYELQKLLGGGMSHVYLARDTVIGRTVAVKILTEAGCQDTEAKMRFLAEARMAGNISHENIVSIYDVSVRATASMHKPLSVLKWNHGGNGKAASQAQEQGGSGSVSG